MLVFGFCFLLDGEVLRKRNSSTGIYIEYSVGWVKQRTVYVVSRLGAVIPTSAAEVGADVRPNGAAPALGRQVPSVHVIEVITDSRTREVRAHGNLIGQRAHARRDAVTNSALRNLANEREGRVRLGSEEEAHPVADGHRGRPPISAEISPNPSRNSRAPGSTSPSVQVREILGAVEDDSVGDVVIAIDILQRQRQEVQLVGL